MFENIVRNRDNMDWVLDCGDIVYCGSFIPDSNIIISYTLYYKRFFYTSCHMQIVKVSRYEENNKVEIELPNRREIIKHKLSHSRLPDFVNVVNSKIRYIYLLVNECYYHPYVMDIEAYVYPEINFCSKT